MSICHRYQQDKKEEKSSLSPQFAEEKIRHSILRQMKNIFTIYKALHRHVTKTVMVTVAKFSLN